jgi:hypothetical protein
MPRYVSNILSKFQHDAPKHPQHTPSQYVTRCCCLALRRTMTCGVCGVTARLAGVFCLRWEFGVECADVFGWGDICCAFVFATLGGENVVCTL